MGFPSIVMGLVERSPSENIRAGKALSESNETDDDREKSE
jgi:hypothetical protein